MTGPKDKSALGTGVESLAQGPNGGNRPVPDPTILTTQQLLREVAATREIIDAQTKGIKDTLNARLDGMEKEIGHLQKFVDQRQLAIDAKVGQLQELHDEKFNSIKTQFAERDTRTEQNARDTKVAVDAALQAAEKAVGKQQESFALATAKSENATTKQIDQQGLQLNTETKRLDDKIDDIKERLNAIDRVATARGAVSEGHTKGIGESWGVIIAVVGMVVGFVSVVGVITAIVARMN